jgi:hypothetical protein
MRVLDANLESPVERGEALAGSNRTANLVTIGKMNHTLQRVEASKDPKAASSDPRLPLAPDLVDALAEFLSAPAGKGR